MIKKYLSGRVLVLIDAANLEKALKELGVHDEEILKMMKDTLGSDNEHLKAFVKQGNSESFGAIGFGLGNKLDLVTNKNKFDAIFSLEENEWKDTVTLQLQLRDINASNG